MNIVAVGAHQDDVELNCLGTLLRYREREDATITNVTISNGEKGGNYDPTIPYETIARIRMAEADAVAKELGGRYVCLGQEDEYIEDNKATRNKLVQVLRDARADVVFAPPPVDYNTDHTISSGIVYHACLLSSVRTIGKDPLPQSPVLFYMDTITGLEFNPTSFVDISSVFSRKCELLRLHDSQMRGMQAFGGWDLVTYCQKVNAFRGLQCGVEFAEAFRPALGWPRVRAGNWLP